MRSKLIAEEKREALFIYLAFLILHNGYHLRKDHFRWWLSSGTFLIEISFSPSDRKIDRYYPPFSVRLISLTLSCQEGVLARLYFGNCSFKAGSH